MKLGQNLTKTFFDYYKATGYIASRLLQAAAAAEPTAKQQAARDARQQ